MKKTSRIFCFILSSILALNLNCLAVLADNAVNTENTDTLEPTISNTENKTPYSDYYDQNSQLNRPTESIAIQGLDMKASETANNVSTQQGKKGSYLGPDNKWNEWSFQVNTAGVYSIMLEYYAITSIRQNVELSVQIDGQYPFNEAANITVPRLWKDDLSSTDFQQDSKGNELRPKQVEISCWQSNYLTDSTGIYNEPYLFALTPGLHTIKIIAATDSFELNTITFLNQKEEIDYNSYLNNIQSKNNTDTPVSFKIEAEHASAKSVSTIYPASDRSGPATTPSDASHIKLNTIGGNNWKKVGETLTWDIDVPSSGYYQIAMRVRQNLNQGMNSYRTLYIDGTVPFKEARDIKFPYALNWYIKTIGEDNDISVYLTKGKHQLSLECSSGEVAPVLRSVKQAVNDLNTIYRKIIMMTGTTPDQYRDYQLDKTIPGLIDDLNSCKTKFEKISKEIKRITDEQGSKTSLIDQEIVLLDDLIKRPDTIPERLSSFSGNTESLGALILSLSEQPIELDSISFVAKGKKLPSAKADVVKSFVFDIKAFLMSFLQDYGSIGNAETEGKSISAWVTTGRDQAQVLRAMIDDTFTPKTKISVELNIVDTGATLLQATLAGKGPNVALLLPKENVINFAMRDGLVNLKNYDLESLDDNYYPNAWIPYEYQDGIYALPETQSFDMLFYRTDIFKELNLTVPNTWDDFYKDINVIQSANLKVGIQEMDRSNLTASLAIPTFEKFLFQKGGTFYTSDLSKTVFDSDAALEAFDKTTKLYTYYKLDREYDFFNRFRSGEMPMAIVPYTQYNMLMQAAPEITGMWTFCPIPGTVDENGVINRAESSTGTGCVLLKSALNSGKDKEAFSFMNWWVSSETQGRYGNDIESIMGTAARYTPANRKALEMLPWTESEKTVINKQWNYVTDVRQLPGNYEVIRDLTSAIRLTIDGNLNPRRELLLYNKAINNELARKRTEFAKQ